MKRLDYLLSLFFISGITLSFCFTSSAQAPKSRGKYIRNIKEPKCAHITNELNDVKVKRIRGKLFIGNNETPIGSIISVYKITNTESRFIFSYLVGKDGKFNFKQLKEGTYFLKTGTTNGYFNQNNIKILLAPKDKDSSEEELEIPLAVGT